MIYLDEDAVKFQIDLCRQSRDPNGDRCTRCKQKKDKRSLCPLGRESEMFQEPKVIKSKNP